MRIILQIFLFIMLTSSCSNNKNNINRFEQDNENKKIEYDKLIKEFNEKYPVPSMYDLKISDFYIGKDISEYSIESRHLIIIDANQLYPFFIVRDNGILYKIAYSEENIVKYIIVDQQSFYLIKFETPEKITIGMTYKELNDKILNIKLYEMRGFGYFGQLPSGWKIMFFMGQGGTDHYPYDEDKIISIYQGGREWNY